MEIIINGITIDDYLNKYQCQIISEYDSNNSFEAIDGTKNDVYLGDRRILQVDFEPMSTTQINELFTAIKSNRDITITYIDPKDGNATRTFRCDELPSATYFESDINYDISDNSILFWMLPTITFTQKDVENEGGSAGITYNYRLFIDGYLYPSGRISKDTKISNSISADGFSVGNISSGNISGKVLMLNEADVPRNNAEIVFQMQTVNNEVQSDWFTLGIFYLKEMQISNKVMSFSGQDSAAFLDNNYYVNYQRSQDGEIIPQTVQGHITAITELIKTLTNHSEFTIPSNCDSIIIQPQEEQNARTILTKAAESCGLNYRQKITQNSNRDSIQLEFFVMGQELITFSKSQISNLQYGKIGENIETIILYCGSITKLPTHIYSTMYKDYNIYIIGGISGNYPKAANTLEVEAPYYPFTAAAGGGNFLNYIGINFGTEFSISKARINSLIPIGSEIQIADINTNSNNLKFYATSINYEFTKNGIYASISGSSRNISDYFYVGGMQRELENKLSLNTTYNNIYIDTEGIYLSAPKVVEQNV